MDQNVGFAMYMGIKWKTSCSFIFQAWSTEDTFFYIIGLIISMAITCFTFVLPTFKSKIIRVSQSKQSLILQTQNDEQISYNHTQIAKLFFYYFIYSTMHVVVMMLFMTFNGGVVISVMIGMILAHIFFKTKDTDSDSPINCCANSAH